MTQIGGITVTDGLSFGDGQAGRDLGAAQALSSTLRDALDALERDGVTAINIVDATSGQSVGNARRDGETVTVEVHPGMTMQKEGVQVSVTMIVMHELLHPVIDMRFPELPELAEDLTRVEENKVRDEILQVQPFHNIPTITPVDVEVADTTKNTPAKPGESSLQMAPGRMEQEPAILVTPSFLNLDSPPMQNRGGHFVDGEREGGHSSNQNSEIGPGHAAAVNAESAANNAASGGFVGARSGQNSELGPGHAAAVNAESAANNAASGGFVGERSGQNSEVGPGHAAAVNSAGWGTPSQGAPAPATNDDGRETATQAQSPDSENANNSDTGNIGGTGENSPNNSETVTQTEPGSEGDPILLDLNNDGISITSRDNSNHFFDMAGDGYKHRAAWAGAGDGVLAIGANGDGVISERNEIVFTDWDASAQSDMDALRKVFDSNANGKLDAGDARCSSLRVVVTNVDGTTTVTSTASNPDGSLASETRTRTSADGRSIALTIDHDGDRVVDHHQSRVTAVGGATATTEGIANYTAAWRLLDYTTTIASADVARRNLCRPVDVLRGPPRFPACACKKLAA